jgi:hypothetical protein
MVKGATASVKLKNKLCLITIFYSTLHNLPSKHDYLFFNIFALRAAVAIRAPLKNMS